MTLNAIKAWARLNGQRRGSRQFVCSGIRLPGQRRATLVRFASPLRGGMVRQSLRLGAPVLLAVFLLGPQLFAADSLAWEPGPGYRRARLTEPQGGRAGFREMSAAATGIRFQNRLSPIEAAGNNNLMNGSGVAAGDVDGDGWCDLYFCTLSGTNALYRNLGNWRFEDITAQAGVGCAGTRNTGALFGDVDADGDLDLLVASLGQGVRCFINDGRGHFNHRTAEAGLTTTTGSTSLALADVDGDGDLDLYVANYGEISLLRSGGHADMRLVNGQWIVVGPHAKRLRIVEGRLEELGEPDVLYLNDGRGHFQAVPWNSSAFLDELGQPRAEPWDYGLSVQMRDLNGDRAPEIYVCNDFQTVDRFWINDGRGHFRLLPRLAMRKQSFSSMAVDFGDLDRDGSFDFFVTEMMSRHHSDRVRQLVGMAPYRTPPGELEGRPEVARNTLFRNWGDGEFVELAYYAGVAASDWTWQGLLLDADLDGYEDLLVCNGMMYDVQDRDVLDQVRRLGAQTPEQSRTNLWRYPPFLSPNVAWRNRGDFKFDDVSRLWEFDSRRISQGAAMADLDHDGDLDLAINTLNAEALLLRNESQAPRLAVRLRGRIPNSTGIGALVLVSGGPGTVQMQEMLCGGHYLSGDETLRTFAAGSASNRLNIEVRWRAGGTTTLRDAVPGWIYEIEEPGKPSVSPAPPATNRPTPLFEDVTHLLAHTHHEEFFPDYALQPLLMKQLSQFGPGVAWCDLDSDGQPELVIGTGKGGTIEVFRIQGDGFEKIPLAVQWQAPDDITGLTGWVWTDGRRSVLAALAHYEAASTASVSVLEISLTGNPPQVRIAPLAGVSIAPASPGPLAAADMDGDGQLELFVGGRLVAGAYPEAAHSALFRQQNGTLIPDEPNTQALRGVGMVSGATWSDLDLNGYPELILACDWGPVRVFVNQEGRLRETTAELGLQAFTGCWNGVATGDFDEDGRLDIVASNWGLNGGYAASPEHPLHLYFGRITQPDRVDVIESYFAPELGYEVPLRGLNALRQAFPQLSERHPTHASFSRTPISEVLQALPNPTQSHAVTTLASTLFLNRGSNFVAVPLPRDAQLAPAFHVGIADADGDGHEDVFLSQNFFAVRPEWHRMDGGRGLLLLGDGQGGFRVSPGQESALKIYGEQRGAAWVDYNHDGRPDLVVSQNGTATRLFRNTRATPGLRVTVRGPRGNPEGMGTALRLGNPDGRQWVKTIAGAAGYWSQAESVAIFPQPRGSANLEVLWPGGRKSTHVIAEGTRELRIEGATGTPSPQATRPTR